MPLHVEKQKGKFRLVERDGNIAKTNSGTAVDGGGHESRAKAEAQIRAIEASKHK